MTGCFGEHVVEAWCAKFEMFDCDALSVECSHNVRDIACALGEANAEGAFGGRACFAELGEHFTCGFDMVVGHRDEKCWCTYVGFEGFRPALLDDFSVVDDRNAISELIGLFEILSGE